MTLPRPLQETSPLLQNEGYLMQGCLKAALSGILAVDNRLRAGQIHGATMLVPKA